MLYIAHRVNTSEQLAATSRQYGVELDLRDRGDQLVVWHDPFPPADAIPFAEYLRSYQHGLMILNVKSERIEWRVLELVQQFQVSDYFFLDSSFPMQRQLASRGVHQQAVRFSEFEPVESALSMVGAATWVWIDCFTKMPLTDHTYSQLKPHFKLCLVSPELQGRSVETIAEYAQQIRDYELDAVCTKRPDLWQASQER